MPPGVFHLRTQTYLTLGQSVDHELFMEWPSLVGSIRNVDESSRTSTKFAFRNQSSKGVHGRFATSKNK